MKHQAPPKHRKAKKQYCDNFKEALPIQINMQPIGVVHSPYKERFATPRQPGDNRCIEQAQIELYAGSNFDQALQDLNSFSHIWVIYWMHLNQGWNPTVKPPRGSDVRRGVFATRAPHRPNPIGLSLVKLISIKKRNITIEGLDMLDGTPVLDIKPYLAYAEAIPDASHGWLQPHLDSLENQESAD